MTVPATTEMGTRYQDEKMKMRPSMTRISMWPASMLAKSRTESEMSRMNCEMTSSGTISARSGLGTPSGIQLFK